MTVFNLTCTIPAWSAIHHDWSLHRTLERFVSSIQTAVARNIGRLGGTGSDATESSLHGERRSLDGLIEDPAFGRQK